MGMIRRTSIPAIVLSLFFVFSAIEILGQSTSFTFQGNLTESGQPAEGTYDFEFRLFDLAVNGSQQGPLVTANGVTVSGGSFTVLLDFGNEFTGTDRWVEISVRQSNPAVGQEGLIGGFTLLAPRQKISTVPYTMRSSSSASADSALSANDALALGGVAAGQFVVTTDPRLDDARTPTHGSADYVQNTTTQQSSSNFNISGTGKADIFDAGTRFDIGGVHILSAPGEENLFAGVEAGAASSSSSYNSFFGYHAGRANTANDNSFFGDSAGLLNTTGDSNSFMGRLAGQANTAGRFNAFFGAASGFFNNLGNQNAFFGRSAGLFNMSGDRNTFIGEAAGATNGNGNNNTALGNHADFATDDLSYATAIGSGAVVFSSNTIVLGRDDGSDTVLVPGRIVASGGFAGDLPRNDTNYIWNQGQNAPFAQQADFWILGTGTANTLNAVTQFGIGGTHALSNAGVQNLFAGDSSGLSNVLGRNNSFFGFYTGKSNTTGESNSFFGSIAGRETTVGGFNSFFGAGAGNENTEGNYNSFFGASAGFTNVTGTNNTAIGYGAHFASGDLNYATAIGSGSIVPSSNTILLGRTDGSDDVVLFGNLGLGTDSPAHEFDLAVNSGNINMGGGGCPSGSVVIGFNGQLAGCNNYSLRGRNSLDLMLNRPTGGQVIFRENNGSAQIILHSGGEFEVRQLGSAGSTQLCRNGSNRIATCSSSLRYKNNVEDFTSGIDILSRMRPVTFNWKDSGDLDVGLVAEEVAKVEPLLVTFNSRGVVEGVKYDRIGVLLVNVVKQQREEIESLRREVANEKEKIGKQEEILSDQNSRIERLEKELEMLKSLVCASQAGAGICREQ